jgi:LacI family transcriptional regulator, galactose operon repressor
MAKSPQPTIYDVAKLAGVSTATVSRSLNGTGQTAPSTRLAIEAAVRQLGYQPNRIARSLVTKSTQTIALLLPDITNPFYASLVSGIEERTLALGYTMLLCTTEGDSAREELYLNLLRSKQVDGALVDGLVLSADRVARFVAEGFPIVCLDRNVASNAVPLVQVDNHLGARLATEHLLELGHTRIAHVAGAPELRISGERVEGYQEALSRAGIEADPALLAVGGFTEDGGYEAARALLSGAPRPTAIFAANDLSAVGALEAIAESGLKVPDDVSVVGFDDLRLAAYTTPPLTTIHQPARQIGERATSLLLDLTMGKKVRRLRTLLEPGLVVRRSTAPLRLNRKRSLTWAG